MLMLIRIEIHLVITFFFFPIIFVPLLSQGMHALETLLVSHVDSAFDRFQAWALRNTFDVPDGLELVIVSPAPPPLYSSLILSPPIYCLTSGAFITLAPHL